MLSAYSLAKELSVSPMTVYRWMDHGIPYTYERIGNRSALKFDLKEVDQWIEKQKEVGAIRQK